VFQPVGVSVFLMTALWLGGTGMIGKEDDRAVSDRVAPRLLWARGPGSNSSGGLDEAGFRRVVLLLLLLSGISLLFRL